jgi:3-oxoacyl-[acyl-carrier-protein] synthase III
MISYDREAFDMERLNAQKAAKQAFDAKNLDKPDVDHITWSQDNISQTTNSMTASRPPNDSQLMSQVPKTDE